MRSAVLCSVLLLTACERGAVRIDDGENAPPTEPEVKISPGGPDSSEDLEAEIVFESTDPDGDRIEYVYVWLRDGDVTEFTGPTISADETERDERWEVRVRASDGQSESETVSDEVKIDNAPPSLSLSWRDPDADSSMDLVVRAKTEDADDDDVTLSYVWRLDGDVTPWTDKEVPASATSAGDVWEVTVTATDEEDDDTEESLSIELPNGAPVLTDLVISPSPARPRDDLVASYFVSDPDGDAVSTSVSWTQNGVATAVTGLTVDDTLTSDGDVWAVTVTATDSFGGSDTQTASVVVENHAPVVQSVTITPAVPGDNDTLRANVDVTDADADPLAITYDWVRNGSSTGFTGVTVGAANTTLGDTWTVRVTVSDGTTTVGPLTATAVTLVDRPPSAPVVVLDPELPTPCSDLVCVMTTASLDPDGTAVTYAFSWQRNGVTFTGPRTSAMYTNDTIPADQIQDGDTWTCRVLATSGALSVSATVEATAPPDLVVDTFPVPTGRTAVDVLLVVDDSCSMSPYQTLLADAASTLTSELSTLGLTNYQIGVVTTDMENVARTGRMIEGSHGQPYVVSSTPDRDAVLQAMITVGIDGSPYEKGLDAVQAALTAPLTTNENLGFLRSASTPLAVLFLTDEPDQSTLDAATFASWIGGLRSASNLTTAAIMGDMPDGCVTIDGFGWAGAGTGYASALDLTGGWWTSICAEDYTPAMREFAAAAANRPRAFSLSAPGSSASMTVVRIASNGTRTTLVLGVDWTYDAPSHRVVLTSAPAVGSTIEVTYDTCE